MYKKINEFGICQIKKFLAANHKQEDFTDEMLLAWAADAEFQMREGNTPSIEIGSFDCIHGRTVTFTISDDGIDIFEEIEG